MKELTHGKSKKITIVEVFIILFIAIIVSGLIAFVLSYEDEDRDNNVVLHRCDVVEK